MIAKDNISGTLDKIFRSFVARVPPGGKFPLCKPGPAMYRSSMNPPDSVPANAVPFASFPRLALRRRDLILFEHRLRGNIGSFIDFKTHSLYFPRLDADSPESLPRLLAEEKKLLLPLFSAQGENLGVFMARGVDAKAATAILSRLPALAALCLDNLQLYKQSLCDPVTGLYSRHHLLSRISRELDLLRESQFAPGPEPEQEENDPTSGCSGRSCLGVIVVRLASLRDVVREYGYLFADRMVAALADTLTTICPEGAISARTGDFEFAIFLPAATPATCRSLALELAGRLRETSLRNELTGEQVRVGAALGYAGFPQDMDLGPAAPVSLRSSGEDAPRLLRKARLAAALAAEKPRLPGTEQVMGFGRILAEGGSVLNVLPLSRYVISLGRSMNAREGRCFSVWSPDLNGGSADLAAPPLYKGEIVLIEVRENSSLAELVQRGDPSLSIEPGDQLTLLPDPPLIGKGGDSESSSDSLTGFLRHGEFLARFSVGREECEAFSLAVLRLGRAGGSQDEEGAGPRSGEQRMAETASMCRAMFGRDLLGGRYGLDSLIFFHPGLSGEEAHVQYRRLATDLESRLEASPAVGIACYPYLDFRKADVLDNCLKALDYALLLPKPQVGLLDSLALNISADRRFSLGDSFGAIAEYKQALLADPENTLAWNSLGISMARLSRHAEAAGYFSSALERAPDDLMALYNLGHVCQILGERAQARTLYQRCLELSPDHLYALIRLGQLEEADNPAQAVEYYRKAALLPGGAAVTSRYLARLSMREGKNEEAREQLHEALLHDPQDAMALQLLARLFLDGGEDPAMAETLARQSVALKPSAKGAWLELARALEAGGKSEAARQALSKAEEL